MRIWIVTMVAAATWSPWAAAEDWSGFYAGARGGYGATDYDGEETFRDLMGSEFMFSDGAVISMGELWDLMPSDCFCTLGQNDSGGIFGAHIGYNWQFNGQFVLGIEAAVVRSRFKDATNVGGVFEDVLSESPVDAAMAGGFIDFELGSIFSTVARAGIAFDRFLVTGAAGVAFSKANVETLGVAYITMDDSSAGSSFFELEGDGLATGLVLGVGLEYALTQSVALRLDYQHIAFRGFDLDGVQLGSEEFEVPTSREIDFGVNLVTAGVNFRF